MQSARYSCCRGVLEQLGRVRGAGDGTILGGSDEWNAQIDSWAADVDHYLYWNNDNMHVAVLGRNAASYTTELQTAYVRTSGDTLRMKGSWTYVFKRFGDDWQVIHGNGTHLFE